MAKICIIGVKQNNIINNLLTTIKVTTNDEKQENLKLITEINCSNEASILVYEGYLCFESLNKFENEIQNDKIITLGFKINQNTFDAEYLQNKYIANIEVKSASDIILKKSFEIEKRFIDLEMQDVDDNIQIEVFNLSNNKCVYKRNLRFIANGTTVIHQVKKELNTIQCKYAFEKTKENPTAEIASLENVRKMWTRRIKRKDESEFVRFDNFEETEALKYLIKTLKSTAKNKGFEDKLPEHIYLADPYLFCKLNLTKYINIFNEYNKEGLKTIELRLIGCQNSIPEYLINELRKSPHKYSSIKIKSIRKKKTDNNGIVLPPKIINGKQEYETQETFHDRFIASKHIEYGFTNSINNLRKGVTFFRSFDIYFEDAEELWNINYKRFYWYGIILSNAEYHIHNEEILIKINKIIRKNLIKELKNAKNKVVTLRYLQNGLKSTPRNTSYKYLNIYNEFLEIDKSLSVKLMQIIVDNYANIITNKRCYIPYFSINGNTDKNGIAYFHSVVICN